MGLTHNGFYIPFSTATPMNTPPRKTLSLKKSPQAAPSAPVPLPAPHPVANALPPKPPELAAKGSAPAKAKDVAGPTPEQIAKEKIESEIYAQLRRQAVQFMPQAKAFFKSHAVMTEVLLIDGKECLRPLSIKTRKVLRGFAKDNPDFDGCQGKALDMIVSIILRPHTASERYLNGLLASPVRYRLDGAVEGVVRDEHKAHAARNLEKLVSKRSALANVSNPAC